MRCIFLDTEFNRAGELLLLGLSDGNSVEVFTSKDSMHQALKNILEDDRILLVGHNLVADLSIIRKNFPDLSVKAKVFDTMLMAQMANSYEGRGIYDRIGLSELEGVGKEIRSEFLNMSSEGISEKHVEYLKEDVRAVKRLFKKQVGFLERYVAEGKRIYGTPLKVLDGLEIPLGIYAEFQFVKVLSKWHGVYFDEEQARVLYDRLDTETKDILMRAKIKYGIEVSNHNQIQSLLGVKSINKKMITKEEIEKIKEKGLYEVYEYRTRWSFLKKQKDTVESILEKLQEGRVKPELWQIGAPTFRMSCKNPNLMQIPKGEVRSLIKAPEGYVLVVIDFSAIELRLAGAYLHKLLRGLYKDFGLYSALVQGADLHRLTASKFTGKLPEDVSKEERQLAKAVNFGTLYGASAGTLAQTLEAQGFIVGEPEKLIEGFYRAFPEVERWHKLAKNSGLVLTLGGRLIRSSSRNTTLNYPIQGSGADLLKVFCVLLDKLCEERGIEAKQVLWIHDETVIEVKREHTEALMQAVEEARQKAGRLVLGDVPFAIEVAQGDVYSK